MLHFSRPALPVPDKRGPFRISFRLNLQRAYDLEEVERRSATYLEIAAYDEKRAA